MKAHLTTSEVPLIEGQNYIALCQREVPRSRFVYWFDSGNAPEFLSALSAINICRECYRAELTQRYVYGLIPGEESMHEQNIEEEVAA